MKFAKVMFLHMSVILSTGGLAGPGGWGCMVPGGGSGPRGGAWSEGGCLMETPRWLLLQPVCTLLECILVININERD